MFIIIELKVKSPIIPMHLFKNSIFTISNIVVFLPEWACSGALK